jgi:photosynthetic reaction center H subunit
MNAGHVFGSIDVAQIAIWLFWLFFAGLVYYLHREDKREGYPLEDSDASPYGLREGFPGVPPPKTYVLAHGQGTVSVPAPWVAGKRPPLNAKPAFPFGREPLVPVGNPLLAGVGPGSWNNRPDRPDLTWDNLPKIVPLRVSGGHQLAAEDPDPRGKGIYGADEQRGGTVTDLWVDRAEEVFRYLEVEVAGGRRVLVPLNFAYVSGDGTVSVPSILGAQFADVPGTRKPDEVTFLEEDKIMAYYGAGLLYATPDRQEPLL